MMKKEIIQQLYSAFEQAALEIDGVECWSARELQALLGYSKWENFANVINKAKIACENVGHNVSRRTRGQEFCALCTFAAINAIPICINCQDKKSSYIICSMQERPCYL